MEKTQRKQVHSEHVRVDVVMDHIRVCGTHSALGLLGTFFCTLNLAQTSWIQTQLEGSPKPQRVRRKS